MNYKICTKCGKLYPADSICCKRKYRKVTWGTHDYKFKHSYAWKKKSKAIREKAHHLCEVCLDCGELTYDYVEVHHIVSVKHDDTKKLDDTNLIAVCKEHHKQAEDGRLPAEYLKRLARQREENYAAVLHV